MSGGEPYDIFVVGGGINGCGIARDAAGRGFSVFLSEMNDLGSGTSSGSTKLIHGGLRYLEHYEFRLVRKALTEREVLWSMAPHIIWPMRFVLPHHRGMRPAWLLRLGLFLYDHIGGRKALPAARRVDLTQDEAGNALKPEFRMAFEYSDCWVNDARLVALNARDAADRGAVIRTRSKVTRIRRQDGIWHIGIEDTVTGEVETVTARLVVNAAGPWIDHILGQAAGQNDVSNIRLVQGSHIVVRRKFEHDRAYFFQNADGRIFFAIPYEAEFTLIGTTDRDYTEDLDDIAISDEEVDYLCAGASAYFKEPVTRDDIVWTYSAVRPLYDDGASKAQEATRDYVLKTEGGDGQPALINIFGGKITTYRRLAESVLERVEKQLERRGASWTAGAALPGGDFPIDGYDAQVSALRQSYPFLAERHARRLVRLYGTRARDILGDAETAEAMGRRFGDDLFECEIRYLVEKEWAVTADDILWRRTKRGLTLSRAEADALADYLSGGGQDRPSQGAQ